MRACPAGRERSSRRRWRKRFFINGNLRLRCLRCDSIDSESHAVGLRVSVHHRPCRPWHPQPIRVDRDVLHLWLRLNLPINLINFRKGQFASSLKVSSRKSRGDRDDGIGDERVNSVRQAVARRLKSKADDVERHSERPPEEAILPSHHDQESDGHVEKTKSE